MSEPTCEQLVNAFNRAYHSQAPCDVCREIREHGRYPTCGGQHLCRDCYEKAGRPAMQAYPGDRGHRIATEEEWQEFKEDEG